jgi:Lon protease-like protein
MAQVMPSVQDMPAQLRLFPLARALLLPRCQLPLNIFEPRYLAMVDDALKNDRLIGMIQPLKEPASLQDVPELFSVGCVGRITHFSETGDGRYLITLTGMARFAIARELPVGTPFRQAEVDFSRFSADFLPGAGEARVNRQKLVEALRGFTEAHQMKVDWSSVDGASSELLVNTLAMLSPFGLHEKQLMLEAEDLKDRADALIAATEFDLARSEFGSSKLQ